MKKSCWADNEVKDLFSQVESVKEGNKPLKDAFILHAKKYSRKPNSVRNYYYYQLEELENDADKTSRLGIDLRLHKKVEIEYFSSESEEKLVKDIQSLVQNGMSIRKACQKLSNGDLNLMLRYQNKYRNYLLKQNKNNVKNNIIKFKKKKTGLSESDINSLFLGLVKLVKRSAIEEYSSTVQAEKESANASLRKALVDLTKKEKELEKLKEEFSKLKLENSKLVQKMLKLQVEKASTLSQNNAKI